MDKEDTRRIAEVVKQKNINFVEAAKEAGMAEAVASGEVTKVTADQVSVCFGCTAPALIGCVWETGEGRGAEGSSPGGSFVPINV